jgi:hypothetical protein
MRWPLLGCTLAVWLLALAAAQGGGPPAAAPSPLVQRFLSIPDPAPSSYRALRHLDAENSHFHTSAWMDVWTEADESLGFRYHIASEGGSEFIRSRVFRETLEMERRMWANGRADRATITPDNYVLEDGPPGDDGPSIVLRPRRKDVLLVDGFIVLNKDDGELVRVEGLLSKTPSFWTRRVHVTRYFQRFAGVRMPVVVETVANVLVAGRSTLRMSYDYEHVNGVRLGAPQVRNAAP